MVDYTTMLDFCNTGSLSLSILQVIQIQIWKKGKEKDPSTLLYKIVWLIFKSFFFVKLISSIVPIHENLKDPWKMFFPFSCFRSCSFHRFLSRWFLSYRKRKPGLFSTLSREKLKQIFIITPSYFQNKTKFK